MLVITRCLNDDLYIDHGGERLVVRVVQVQGRKVRLGLKGSKSFVIKRREVAAPQQPSSHCPSDDAAGQPADGAGGVGFDPRGES